MNENDILGFDPSQLSVFAPNEKPASQGNSLIYRTRPADSKDDDKVYRCTIKPVYSPQDLKHSILEQQSYSMQDADGWFSAVSSLTVNDLNCPIFKAWKKCHFAKKEDNPVLWAQAAKKEDGGNAMFDKRFARYCTVQIIDDKNQPELVGKYMFIKLPKSIWEIINTKMNPAASSGKAPIPVMDFLFGRSLDLEVKPGPGKEGDTSWTRETSYYAELSEDVVSCTNPDGSSLLNDSEQRILDEYVAAMKPIWREKDAAKRATMLAEVNASANTAEFRKIYARVIEEIKTFCPDLNKELGYKPWDANLTNRVNAWIDVVLTGNNPAENAAAPAVVAEKTSAETAPFDETPATSSTASFSEAADNDSDLPF